MKFLNACFAWILGICLTGAVFDDHHLEFMGYALSTMVLYIVARLVIHHIETQNNR